MKEYKNYIFNFDLIIADTTHILENGYKKIISLANGKFNENNFIDYLANPHEISDDNIINILINSKASNTGYTDNSKKKIDLSFVSKQYYDTISKNFIELTNIYKDVLYFIEKIYRENTQLAIVCNYDVENIIKLLKEKEPKLLKYFNEENIFGRNIDNIYSYVPTDDILKECIEKLNLSNQETIYIGYSENDYLAAQKKSVNFGYINRYTRNDLNKYTNVINYDTFYKLYEDMIKGKVKEIDEQNIDLDNENLQKAIKLFDRIAESIKNNNSILMLGPNLDISDGELAIVYQRLIERMTDETPGNDKYCRNVKASMKMKEAQETFIEQKGIERYTNNVLKNSIYNSDNIQPLRSHKIFAKLPFLTYISFEYNDLMKKALKAAKKPVSCITKDEEIANWDIIKDKDKLPLFYPLGFIEGEDGKLFRFKDYCLNKKDKMTELFSLLFTKKQCICVGFDDDEIEAILNKYELLFSINKPIFIQDVNEGGSFYLKENEQSTQMNMNIEIFAKLLLKSFEGLPFDKSDLNKKISEFPDTFFELAIDPTETQAIDMFLKEFEEKVNSKTNISIDTLINSIKYSGNFIEHKKQNFVAFKSIYERLINLCEKEKNANSSIYKVKVKQEIFKIQNARKIVSNSLKLAGEVFFCQYFESSNKSLNIGLYGVSETVLMFLSGMPLEFNGNVTIYISECTIKKSNGHDEYVEYCDKVRGILPGFKIIVVPDVLLMKMIKQGKINKVFFGTHAIYSKDDKPFKIINLCGIGSIVELAKINNVDIYFISENNKVKDYSLYKGFTPKSIKHIISNNVHLNERTEEIEINDDNINIVHVITENSIDEF